MFHRVFLNLIRHRQAKLLADVSGLTADEANRQLNLVPDAKLTDLIVQARVKEGLAFPGEAYGAGIEAVDSASLPDGHRIKHLEDWLKAHPGFETVLKVLLSVLITALLSGS